MLPLYLQRLKEPTWKKLPPKVTQAIYNKYHLVKALELVKVNECKLSFS